MKHITWLSALASSLSILLFISPSWAQYGEEGSWHGSFMLGFRIVDVDGSEDKFEEDINLDDGPRLFNLNFDFTPGQELRSYVDRVDFDMNHFGGDPFETIRLAVRKYGGYTFNYSRRKSDYFLPDESSEDNTVYFSRFDFERVQDTATLDIRLNKAAKLNFGFERFTKEGDSTITMDIERDEFEFQSPIDESLNEYRGGFEYAWDKVTLVLEERIRDYENAVEMYLPGFSEGEDPTDPATLDFLFLDQPYDSLDIQHTARVLAHPNERLTLEASGSIHDLELDMDASEHSQGIDYTGTPFTTDVAGDGDIERDAELFDFDVSYVLTDRIVILAGAKHQTLDQDGDLGFGSVLGDSEWEMETWGAEAGLDIHLSPALTLSSGIRYENRDVESSWHYDGADREQEEETEGTGYFFNLGWRPLREFRLMAGFEDTSYDDPYSMTSPTDRQMYRIRAQYGGGEGLSISGSYRLTCHENDESGWDHEYETFNIRAGYRIASFSVSLGYSFVDMERDIDQTVATLPGFMGGIEFLAPVHYDADSDYLDGRFIWSFAEHWKLGGDFRLYENDGDYSLKRKDLRAYVEREIGQHYMAHLGYRFVDYDEDWHDSDDYDADIIEIAIGYQW